MRTKRGKNVRIQEVQLHRELLQQGVHGEGRGRDARRSEVCGEKVHITNIIFVCGGGYCKGPISINVFSSFFPDYDTPGFDGDVLSLCQFLAVE